MLAGHEKFQSAVKIIVLNVIRSTAPIFLSTSSSAVADRLRDASYLSLAFAVRYLERRLLLLVTSASDLPLHSIKFCYVLFGVFVHAAGCDKQRFTDASPSVR